MSELKAFRIIQGDTGGYGASSYKCDTDGNRLEEWGDVCEVYDKSETDKVIAELEESHKKEVEQLLMEIVELKEKYKELAKLHDKAIQACCGADKVIAHHKYKRCLAMAKWCYDVWFLCLLDKEAKKSVLYWRWWNIWLELAKKFKEAK